ncbi:shikimate dehydrogenase [Propionibacterium cyclohexanicum]|uniref:Shikimate dehydrogenase n=1 Tax=Propionibacterium cyclohexanicum TaxID=64702 RepID=A0A1H9SY97_9ACTN|nr:shikimate dehydrogenase [Propionibacterium cyclohexanicum]SER89881.1 shikimate dehydrogenase [Propionibacterium cyclohexanicum]
MTHRCAVIGSPIAHSLSPILHRAAYEQLGLRDWSYESFDVTPQALPEFLASCTTQWVGLSVTAPLKSALLEHGLAEQRAKDLNAANTLVFGHPNRLYNTDVTGMRVALASHGVEKAGTAIVLGAGATARSALAALEALGVSTITVAARSVQRAHDSLDPIAAILGVDVEVVDWTSLDSLGEHPADILISTVPTVFEPSRAVQLAALTPVVFDIVYHDYPTNLSRAAQAAGALDVDGVDLLVYQAIDQVVLMTGRRPQAEPLLELCRQAVAARG